MHKVLIIIDTAVEDVVMKGDEPLGRGWGGSDPG
jgi:hypothetical protein